MARKQNSKKKNNVKTKSDKEKILEYVQAQLQSKEEERKDFETSIDPEPLKELRKLNEIILKKEISQLKLLIKHIELV